MTSILLASNSLVTSPAAVCYFVLVVAAGLWHHARLVWWTTLMASASYASLWVVAAWRPWVMDRYDRHIIFLVALFLTGYVVSRLSNGFQSLERRLRSTPPGRMQ